LTGAHRIIRSSAFFSNKLVVFPTNIREFLFIYSLNLSKVLLIFGGILFFNIRELKEKKTWTTRMSPSVWEENGEKKKWIDKFNALNSSKSHPNLSSLWMITTIVQGQLLPNN
jgi:hypothetical protein